MGSFLGEEEEEGEFAADGFRYLRDNFLSMLLKGWSVGPFYRWASSFTGMHLSLGILYKNICLRPKTCVCIEKHLDKAVAMQILVKNSL